VWATFAKQRLKPVLAKGLLGRLTVRITARGSGGRTATLTRQVKIKR
jgi:hypothetical protein